MSIKTKILLVILLATIPPVLFLRITGMYSMNSLSRQVEARTSDILIHDMSTSLQRIVEDHARLLRREQQLINSTLDILSEKTVSLLQEDTVASTLPLPATPESAVPPPNKMKNFCLYSPSGVISTKLEKLVPDMSHFASEYNDLMLWQQIYLNDGSQLLFPTVFEQHPHVKCLFGTLGTPNLTNATSWTRPIEDPIFDETIFAASQPIISNNGTVLGVATIAVPVKVLLRDPAHLTAISEKVRAFIIQASNDKLVILASRETKRGDGTWHTLKQKQLPIAPETVEKIAQNISRNKVGAWYGSIGNNRYVFSYAPIGIKGSALLVAIPREDVVRGAGEEAAELRDLFSVQMDKSHVLLVITIIVVAIFAVFLSSSLSKNIYKLVEAVRKIAKGDLTAKVEDMGKDEIGELGKAINNMVPALKENVHLKDTLQLASVIQKKLQPKQMPSVPGYDIAGSSYYCAETGGDYFDFLTCASNSSTRLLLALGDVVGHGVPAALLMATARAYLRSCTLHETSLSKITSNANELVVCDTYGTGQFMTLFLAALNTLTHELSWTRAGHDAAIMYRAATASFEDVKGDGATALGVVPDAYYQENAISIEQGDILLIASDGVWEGMNPDGKMFGKELVRETLFNNRSATAQELIVILYKTVLAYTKKEVLEDDLTCIVIKRL